MNFDFKNTFYSSCYHSELCSFILKEPYKNFLSLGDLRGKYPSICQLIEQIPKETHGGVLDMLLLFFLLRGIIQRCRCYKPADIVWNSGILCSAWIFMCQFISKLQGIHQRCLTIHCFWRPNNFPED